MESNTSINVEPNWAELQNDILTQVMDKLNLKDYFRCGAVCVPWETVFADGIDKRKKHWSFPFLLIPPIEDLDEYCKRVYSEDDMEENGKEEQDVESGKEKEELDQKIINDKDGQIRSLYNISTGTVSDIQVNVPHNKHCRGSCFGWLITVEETDNDKFFTQLFNPFLSPEFAINLPSLDTLVKIDPLSKEYYYDEAIYLAKAVLSHNPTFSRGDFTIMALVGQFFQLACLMPGVSDWIPVEWEKWRGDSFDDLIYFSKTQQFYAIKHDGLVLAIDIVEEHIETRIVVPRAENNGFKEPIRYLVESPSGELLQVLYYYHERFEVFKLDQITNDWIQIYSLDDSALFLGQNSSRYVSISDVSGCKSNCIYYTAIWGSDRGPFRPSAIYNGVFNMQDGTMQPHYPLHSGVCMTAPIWLDLTFPIGLGSTYICTS